MFVPLAATYEPLRAQRAAGVLRAHGIAAWVTGAASAGGGDTVAAGECLLMVEEGEAEQAARILEASPPPAEIRGDGAHTTGRPLSLRMSLGNGIVQGVVWLPLLTLVLYAFLRVIAALGWASGPMTRHLAVLYRAVFEDILSLILAGALIGLTVGFGTWLLSSYRNRRKAGIAFVGLVVLLLLLPELLVLILR